MDFVADNLMNDRSDVFFFSNGFFFGFFDTAFNVNMKIVIKCEHFFLTSHFLHTSGESKIIL